jgi:hypothetical protein
MYIYGSKSIFAPLIFNHLMKRTLTLFLIILSSLTYGQITQEASYDYSGTFVNLANSGDKFYVMDVANNQCRLYNTNTTLWKTINLAVPANNYVYDIRYVSEGLFTNTNELCLAYVYYVYDEVNLYYTFTTKVIKENGTVLLTIPGCQYLDIYKMETGACKLVTYSYDYSIALYTTTTRVFSLPGVLTGVQQISDDMQLAAPAFPNPANTFITIPYNLSENTRSATLKLVDMNGKTVVARDLDKSAQKITINVNGFPKGTYVYHITSDNITGVATGTPIVTTGKVVIQ